MRVAQGCTWSECRRFPYQPHRSFTSERDRVKWDSCQDGMVALGLRDVSDDAMRAAEAEEASTLEANG